MPPLNGRVIGKPSQKTSTKDDMYVWNMQLVIGKYIKVQNKSIVFEKRKKQQNPYTHIVMETKPDGQFNTHMGGRDCLDHRVNTKKVTSKEL